MKFSLDDSSFLKFENVQLVDNSNQKIKINGSLYLTSSHLVFKGNDSNIEIWIYFSLISSVEKLPLNASGSPILVRCKHFQTCMFIVSKERECQTLALTLIQYSRPTKFQDLLCFKPNEHLKFLKNLTLNENEKIFQLESEYARLGVPNNFWSKSDVNQNYEICDTYPRDLYVPTSANNPSFLAASAKFRSRGRLPVLSYLHHNNACICRCSQPLSGLNARCFEDEQLLQHILQTNDSNKSKVLYVVDTRPKINAMANKAQGKGYENENNYANTQFYFIGIENIHVMRSSLQKLIESSDLTNPSSQQFFTSIEKSEWLKHIKAVIDTSIFISDAVANQNISVLVHCSDGWDRTAQTCALASLLLDPYYRSIHGFQILIEKEWLMFGHKFSHRCGHVYENEHTLKEISPIFNQFLECVWQISQQFPCAFEFNERFLIKLHEHVYSTQFGTFIGNCQKDRDELNLRETTYSLWDYIQYKINDYINPVYKPNSVYSCKVLKPDTRPQNFKYWRALYNRFDACVNSDEKLIDRLLMIQNQTMSLNDYAKLLEKRCAQLKTLFNSTNSAAEQIETISLDENSATANNNKKNKLERESSLTLDQLAVEFHSMELNWKSNLKDCQCSNQFDTINYKLNCLKCGDVYCEKCIEDGKYISNHLLSTKLIFICKKCLN